MNKSFDPQERWDNFWKDILELPDGSIDVEQLKKELSDFSQLMYSVSIIMDEVTGGMVSNPLTDPDVVISLHNDYVNRMCEEYVEDYKEEIGD